MTIRARVMMVPLSEALVFFGATGRELADAAHPLHSLAIPPSVFAGVVEGLTGHTGMSGVVLVT